MNTIKKLIYNYIKYKQAYDIRDSYITYSEEYITANDDTINWKYVSGICRLSEEFIRTNIDRVHLDLILDNQELSNEFKDEIKTLLNKKGEVNNA